MGMEKDLCRVPAALEKKSCSLFCLTVDEEEEHQQSSDNVQEEYRAIDHLILDIAESMGKGKLRKNEDQSKFWPVVCNQALNRLPVLSGLTMFNKIMDAALSDPLTGLYTASNGYLITEVIQFTRKFGQWQENSEIQNYSETESDEENEEIKDPSEVEPCDFIEAVKLTGDPDVPAGQVVFRAKVGEKYKLPPRPALKKKFGAVARYNGKGRLTGF
ncbi:protein EXECUTER 1, chloroplastic-like isoform X2 [Apium graveolens]|uniref:protein EXECUTER 1, chloroplastic-like isoform X2 n=1 Tax=Apium graveolens TaxID=4045 RepID=UPI003D79046A